MLVSAMPSVYFRVNNDWIPDIHVYVTVCVHTQRGGRSMY